ncbi:MAG: hypothetical protein ACM3SW_20340 [Actinomycetota bacterium]
MSTSPSLSPQSSLRQVPSALRRLIALDLLCGLLLIPPLLRPGTSTPGLGFLAIVLFLPYVVVCWRLSRTPGTKEGPGLAAGIGLTFVAVAVLGCAVTIEQRDYLRLGYSAGLGLAHGFMALLAMTAFRNGTSKKPVWRVVARSVLDPIVYYGIVFFLAIAALSHQ